jgi:hypothetical protein
MGIVGLDTLRKTRPDKELKGKLRKSIQKEITLKDDISLNFSIESFYSPVLHNTTTPCKAGIGR